ncbi:MAG: hypothetical protein C4576_30425 [Desulfobacteraceae bacterium]|nr:MAG: hypothetical protein C4576_30425 [Desulfobacteraceae bacterium]
MKGIFPAIIFLLSVAVSCAQQGGPYRVTSAGGYDSQTGSAGLLEKDYSESEEDVYAGSVGGPPIGRSVHGFERGTQTRRWGPEDRPSGPMTGLYYGEMEHGLGSTTSPPALGGSISGGVGQ